MTKTLNNSLSILTGLKNFIDFQTHPRINWEKIFIATGTARYYWLQWNGKWERFVKKILPTPEEEQKSADYNFLRKTALMSEVTSEQWNQFEEKYVIPKPANSKFGGLVETLKTR